MGSRESHEGTVEFYVGPISCDRVRALRRAERAISRTLNLNRALWLQSHARNTYSNQLRANRVLVVKTIGIHEDMSDTLVVEVSR